MDDIHHIFNDKEPRSPYLVLQPSLSFVNQKMNLPKRSLKNNSLHKTCSDRLFKA